MSGGDLAERLRAFCGSPAELWDLCRPYLAGEDWQTRKLAIQALARTPEPEALLPLLVDALKASGSPTLRNSALEVISLLGAPIVPQLLEMVEGRDVKVRKQIVDALGVIASPIAVPRLTMLLADREPNIRFAAAEALGRIASPAAAEALLRHLTTARDGTELFVALQALTQCVSVGPTPSISLHLLRPLRADPLLTRPLLGLLHALRDPAADEFLWDWLRDFQDIKLQEAAKFLGAVDPSELADKVRRYGIPAVRADTNAVRGMLASLDPEIRAGAIWLAVWTGALELLVEPFRNGLLATNHLLHAAESAPARDFADFYVSTDRLTVDQRATLIELIGRTRDQDAIDVLLAMGEENTELRAAAFRWGAELGRHEVLQWLVPLLSAGAEADSIVAGLRALLPNHRATIIALLRPWSESIQATNEWRTFLVLVEQLDLIDLRGRVELAWKRADATVRASALHVLARFQLEHTTHFLGLALADESEDVRLAAAEILADVPDDRHEREVRFLLGDRSPWIRATAVGTLLKIVGERALPDVLRALRDPAEVVRIEAIRALRALHRRDHADDVRAVLDTASADLVAEALRYFQVAAIGPRPGDERWLQHESWRVRIEAVLWLASYAAFRSHVRKHLETEQDPDVTAIGAKVIAS